MLTQFARDKDIAVITCYVADRLGDSRDDERVKLYQYIADQHPQHELAIRARGKLSQIRIHHGDEAGAEALLKETLATYEDHPRLGEAVNLTADGYFHRAVALEEANAKLIGATVYARIVREQGRSDLVKQYYHRAIEKWQIVIRDLPQSSYAPEAWFATGVVYRRHLSDPEKALPFYEMVARTWPQYKYAWSAQGMIAPCYERLVAAGKIASAEADPKIEQAYNAAIEEYPDSFFAKRAYLRLGQISMRKQQWDTAAKYYIQFLERYPEAKEWKNAILYLGLTYERRNQPEMAAELYRTYLDVTDSPNDLLKVVRAKLETMNTKGGQVQ